MITLTGLVEGAEAEAAQSIADAFERQWPGISKTPMADDHVRIHAGIKLSGYKISDIDIVVAAKLSPGRILLPKKVFEDKAGKKIVGSRIEVQSFVCAVEVKDHNERGLKIDGGGVTVRYKDGWKSATEQNEDQRYALLNYLQDSLREKPWVYRCVFLRGIPELPSRRGLEQPEAGTISANFDLTALMMAAAKVNGIQPMGNRHRISSGPPDLIDRVLSVPLFETLQATALDRRRMDQLKAVTANSRENASFLGQERVHLRGRGGTGKTMMLLQAAKRAYESQGTRSLFLTYNHALAADIQRSLSLLGVPADGDDGGVDVRTVMSFNYEWFKRLGLISNTQDFEDKGFEAYEEMCAEACDFIRSGALSPDDIDSTKSASGNSLSYDCLIADEAQDWPQAEADLIMLLYGAKAVSIADGMEQLIRGSATDWKSSLKGEKAEGYRHLDSCLRMKSNLGRFVNTVSEKASFSWKIGLGDTGAGGRVIVARRPFVQLTDLRENLYSTENLKGNSPVDLLHCVPAREVERDGNNIGSQLARALRAEGMDVWDGVDPLVRKDFPRSTKSHRIVQFESARGLEGWITVLDGFDLFWERKYAEAFRQSRDTPHLSKEEQAKQIAWRWAMIPLTRPIDTLVITLRDESSEASKVVLLAAKECMDFVEQV